MGSEFGGVSWTSGRVHVRRTREEPPCSPRIRPNPTYGVLWRFEFEEHVHIFTRFLIPAKRVRLNFHFQRWKTTEEILKQRSEYFASHSQRASDLDGATGIRAASL